MTYHTLLGFCFWDLPCLILLIALLLLLAVRHFRLKRAEKELEEQILDLSNGGGISYDEE